MSNHELESNRLVHAFLSEHALATIATIGKDQKINLANVYAYVDDNFFLYIVSRPDHRKFLNATANQKVSLLFTDSDTLRQVECLGTAYPVDSVESVAELLPRIQEVLENQKTKYWIPPVSQLESSGFSVLKIVPESLVYRSYATTSTEQKIEEISVAL